MPTPIAQISALLARRDEFAGRLAPLLGGDRAAAEDLVQTGLVKALATAGALRDENRLVPWFHRVLRHLAIDHIRARRAAEARHRLWTADLMETSRAPTTRAPCRCVVALAAGLPRAQAELVRRVGLAEEPIARVAASLGLGANTAGVALHRARRSLRKALERHCGECAATACLACDCPARAQTGEYRSLTNSRKSPRPPGGLP